MTAQARAPRSTHPAPAAPAAAPASTAAVPAQSAPAPVTPADEARLSVPFMATRAFSFYEVRFRLDAKQGRVLRVIHDALLQQGAKLQDGHIVDGPHDAVRWLLEQAGRGIPARILNSDAA